MKIHYAMTAAIAVAALVAGLAVGQRLDGAPAETPDESGNQYVMLLYEDASYQWPEPGGMEERVGEYSQWARDVAAAGKYVTGQKLADDGLLLEPGGARVEVIPTAEQGWLGGYFVITATDLDEAASIAETCPHLRYGGTVSLRLADS
ncbi:MAG: YciI family protein [Gammaproteobacteria bacterium]